MSELSKNAILLTERDMDRIKEFANQRFKQFRKPPPLATLILMGFEDFLKSKGIEPQFEVKSDSN